MNIPKTKTQMKKNINQAVDYAANKLNHTRNVCKRSYILKVLLDLYEQDPSNISSTTNQRKSDEKLLYDLLRRHLTCQNKK
jgi:DNA topoisomerase IB